MKWRNRDENGNWTSVDELANARIRKDVRTMRLKKLSMTNFAPFADGEMLFPAKEGKDLAEVQMFTGENGTGKTRVLAALMGALGNIGPLEDRVRQDSGAVIDVCTDDDYTWRFENGSEDPKNPSLPIQLESHCDFYAMGGCGVALLAETNLRSVAELKTARAHESLTLSGPVGGGSIMDRLLKLRMNVALEREVTGGEGKLTTCLQKLEQTILEITGRQFGLHVQPGKDLRLMAQWDGQFLYFRELPDGLRSLLNWLAGWLVLQVEHFEKSSQPLSEPVTLILDEPENHLHPAWQRRVLPAVQKLFPQAQLFVVTHSPFVVSSLNEGWIHKFERGDDGRVVVHAAEKASRGDSYMTAVQDVLGLKEWFDPATEKELADLDLLLDKAYTSNGSSVEAMRKKAMDLMERSEEVKNLVSGLVAQFDRTMSVRKTEKAALAN